MTLTTWKRYFRRARRDEELAREVESYLAHETERNRELGMSAEEAANAARRKFGNPTLTRERVYDRNTVAFLESLSRDVRHGLRQMKANPGFAAVAILSLALGIGANTAIFTLVDQVLVRLLPVENPRELVYLSVDGGRFGSNSGDGMHTFSYPTYVALRDQNTVLRGLTGQRVETVSLVGEDRSEAVTVAMVAGNYFEVFGIKPHLGRLLTPEDDRTLDGHPVAVLQYDFWKAQYQGRPDVVGRTIRLNGTPFTVLGVAGPGFEGTDVGFPNKIWVPVAMRPAITPTDPRLDNERHSWFYLFGRLKPGVTREQAEAAMKVLYRQRQEEELKGPLFAKFPQMRDPFLKQTFRLEPASRGASGLRRQFERPLVILEWLVGAVLLIACSNVAGLLLARGAARQRELAIRGAIGAGRGRILWQLFVESAMLAVAGGALGLALGSVLTKALLRTLPFDPSNLTLSPAPDARVLMFTMAVTALTAILFGMLPAWQNSSVEPGMTMREEAGAVAGGGRAHVRLRKAFVALQVGLSAMLLLGAGVFVRTLRNLQGVDLGLRPENVVQFRATPASPYDLAQKQRLVRSLMEEFAAVPGVRAVGANTTRLFMGGRSDGAITLPGLEERTDTQSFFNGITPGYLEALGIPVREGRDFSWRDWGSGRQMAIVNEALAKEYFRHSPAVGQMMGLGMKVAADTEIVGLAADARYHDVRGEVPRQTFLNMDSRLRMASGINVYARTAGDPAYVMAALRAAAARVDRNVVISDMRTLDEQIGFRMVNERLVSFLSAGFAVLATLLALIGLHGVLSFLVARRTREIGIRVALGCERSRVMKLVAGEMALVIAGGLGAGAAAWYVCGRYVESQLFGVKPNDPVVCGAALALLLAAAAAATLIPAFQAARIDPMRALRHD